MDLTAPGMSFDAVGADGGDEGAERARNAVTLRLFEVLLRGEFNKYHLTTLGRAVASLALQLRTFMVTPALAQLVPARS